MSNCLQLAFGKIEKLIQEMKHVLKSLQKCSKGNHARMKILFLIINSNHALQTICFEGEGLFANRFQNQMTCRLKTNLNVLICKGKNAMPSLATKLEWFCDYQMPHTSAWKNSSALLPSRISHYFCQEHKFHSEIFNIVAAWHVQFTSSTKKFDFIRVLQWT